MYARLTLQTHVCVEAAQQQQTPKSEMQKATKINFNPIWTHTHTLTHRHTSSHMHTHTYTRLFIQGDSLLAYCSLSLQNCLLIAFYTHIHLYTLSIGILFFTGCNRCAIWWSFVQAATFHICNQRTNREKSTAKRILKLILNIQYEASPSVCVCATICA